MIAQQTRAPAGADRSLEERAGPDGALAPPGPSGKAGGLPPAARWLVGLVTAGGAAGLVATLTPLPRWHANDAIAFVFLALATALAEQFPIKIRHGEEIETFTVTDVVWTAGLILAPGVVVVPSVVAGTLLGESLRKTPFVKVLFNTGMFALAMSACEAVLSAFHASSPGDPLRWAGVVAGMSVYVVLNQGLVARVISLAQRQTFLSILLPPLAVNLLHWVGNVAIGVTAGVMWWVFPAGALFMIPPLGLSYAAYMALLREMRERDRMRDLYEAGQVLLSRLESDGDFRPFLGLVARMLDADDVELVVVDERAVTIHDREGSERLIRRRDDGEDRSPVDGYLRARPDLVPAVARVGSEADPRGTLAVFRPKALQPAERSLLESLAAQIYVKLRHMRLFAESEHQREQLEDVLGSTSDGIFVIEADGTLVSWNAAMERITGHPAEQAVGRSLSKLLRFENWSESSLRTASPHTETLEMHRQDGSQGWLRLTWSLLQREDEAPAHVAVARDVTADLELERAKSNLVAAVSHELRTPLTPLKGYLTLLARGDMDPGAPEAAEYFEVMLKHAGRLELLISDLLEVTAIESGQPTVHPSVFDVRAVIDDQVQDYRLQFPARDLRWNPGSVQVRVVADPVRLGQVISNLLSNAMKYSPASEPIEVCLTQDDARCLVSVRDGGEGIPHAEHERVFERFHRLDNGPTRATGGTGLGLYIARHLVEAMSGRLWVQSEPGHGATFTFTLPLASEPAA